MFETKISVIIPVYNTKKSYIDDCLSSILNQNYENLEIIIIDDGSNEETKEVLENYKNKSIIIHQENKGLIGARLTALKYATGDYIIWLDSDDMIGDNSLIELNSIVLKYNPDVILQDPSRFSYSINEKNKKAMYFCEGVKNKNEVLSQLCQLHINSICNKFVKREKYNNIENYIDKSFVNGEDLQQSTYVILNSNSFYYTEKSIYFYRLPLEHRNYYDYKNINDINFLVPTYNMLFKDNHEYDQHKKTYINAAVNSIIYNSFCVCAKSSNKNEKYKILNDINSLEIVNILSKSNIKAKFPLNFLFFCLRKKIYFIINICAHIYDKIIGIQNI